jgi:hypothetical protein
MRLFFPLLILMLSCICNVYSQKSKTKRIEIFDIIRYRHQKKINQYSFQTENGTTVTLKEDHDTYEELRKDTGSNYTLSKIYYKASLTLKSTVNCFQNFPIIIQENYNKRGKLIKRKNWDEGYLFSIADLAQKMQQDFNIDILKSGNGIGVLRGSSGSINYYLVSTLLSANLKGDSRVIKIDGLSGQIISNEVSIYNEDSKK